MTRVLAYCPTPLDGTAYWRVASPFAYLARQAADFRYSIADKVDTNCILGHDVLLLQRPFVDEHLRAAKKARLLGRKVWCDWDDDILNVPVNNPRVFVYTEERFQRNVRELAQMADVVTVTNAALAKSLREGGARDPIVLPNALDPTLMLSPPDPGSLPVRRVAWRGGDSHNQDLLAMGAAFPRVAWDTVGDCVWHFVGFNPHWIVEQFPPEALTVHSWIGDVAAYLSFLGELKPSILAVPLVDDRFNRCKSSISVIEAAWCGAVPVVPEWLEGCSLDGAVTYANEADFERALRQAVTMPDAELAGRRARLREEVAKSWTLDTVNLGRVQILRRLLEKKDAQ